MTTLAELEAAIKQLSESDAPQLSTWLQNYLDDAWDLQIAANFKAGKLNHLIAKAEAYIS